MFRIAMSSRRDRPTLNHTLRLPVIKVMLTLIGEGDLLKTLM